MCTDKWSFKNRGSLTFNRNNVYEVKKENEVERSSGKKLLKMSKKRKEDRKKLRKKNKSRVSFKKSIEYL